MFKKTKEKKQDSMEVKYEKLKLHIKYIVIIAVIIAVIGIAIGLGDNGEFADEMSLASTISSIILSVLAIFMSISGENKNLYTQTKILETADDLSLVVGEMNKVESAISDALNEKLKELSSIKDELKGIKENVYQANDKLQRLTDGVGGALGYRASSKESMEERSNLISNEQIVTIFKRMNYTELGNAVIAEILEYIIVVFLRTDDKKTIDSNEIYEYMKESQKMLWEKSDFNIFWGVARSFSSLGVDRRNKEVCKQLLSEIHNLLGESNEEKILLFSEKYQETIK